MRIKTILIKLRAFVSRAKGGIVQDCPPELCACEVCGKLECRNEVWLNCRQRLAAAQFIQTGDPQALAELKQLRMARDQALSCKSPAGMNPGAKPNPETGDNPSGGTFTPS
jgi:hypothetical protein